MCAYNKGTPHCLSHIVRYLSCCWNVSLVEHVLKACCWISLNFYHCSLSHCWDDYLDIWNLSFIKSPLQGWPSHQKRFNLSSMVSGVAFSRSNCLFCSSYDNDFNLGTYLSLWDYLVNTGHMGWVAAAKDGDKRFYRLYYYLTTLPFSSRDSLPPKRWTMWWSLVMFDIHLNWSNLIKRKFKTRAKESM